MSKLKPRGNIRATSAYDPFPKSGLVKQYEGFIRDHVAEEYCKRYPGIPREDFLAQAVKIAVEFEPKFKPERGYDFSTPLRGHLMGLHRFAKKSGPELIHYNTGADPKTGLMKDEAGEPTRPANYGTDANGTRVMLNRLWISPDPKGGVRRHQIVIATQLPSADEAHARGITQGISEDIPHILADHDRDRVRVGFLRAIVDLRKRNQREADQEAENQKAGDWKPVFLEVRPSHIDIAFYKGKKPPKFKPTSALRFVSLSEHYEHEDGWVGSLYDTVVDGSHAGDLKDDLADIAGLSPEQKAKMAPFVTERLAIIEAERQFMSPNKSKMLDWMLDHGGRSQGQAAAEIGITKGYASKIVCKITDTLRRVLK